MALISILALAAIANLSPARFAAAEPMLRVGQTSAKTLPAPNPKFFEPAISLDHFKNVDPERFEWVNPDEIEAGGTTCGFLKAPLGWEVKETDVKFPLVKIYVCVAFASQQPAARGNLAVHCGGPGSLSSCVYTMGGMLDPDTRSTYNVFSFDQRGMGRSDEPTFIVKECAVPSEKAFDINYDDEEAIRNVAKEYKKTHLQCWNHPDFKLSATQEDDTIRQFHFLEYSGTRQLAEDIERVRVLFGNQKLSIFGISYGTTVMGTYATVFSENVNLMVLDSNVDPSNDIESTAMDWARFKQQRLDYFIASCEFGDFDCGVPDMRACINDVNKMLDLIADSKGSQLGPFAIEMVWSTIGEHDLIVPTCDAARDHDVDYFKDLLSKIGSPSGEQPLQLKTANPLEMYNTKSKPTFVNRDWPNWPFEGYQDLADLTSVSVDMVVAQDKAFGAYDEDRYVHFLQKVNREYSGAGTQMPTKGRTQAWYSATYFWPNITPLPPIGNPDISGIVAGQLYDFATPYVWTQKMREHFKSATLLTSRSVNHAIVTAIESLPADNNCFANILRYFKNGYIDFTDGKVCESDNALTGCTINSILNNQKCSKSNGQSPPFAAE